MRKTKILIILNITLLVFLLGLNLRLNNANAQSNGDSLTIDVNYSLHEFSNFATLQTNINQINISLPSTKWNITNLELNITDIKLGEEVRSIEEGGSNFKSIDKNVKGYGVQLNITEDITLLGVQIQGYLEGVPASPVYVQINGYDQLNNWPNNTVYGEPVPINISINPTLWYVQKFPEPIPLSKGYYYLVVNGSAYVPSDKSKHNWFVNEDDSIHTNLYTSNYEGSVWSIEGQGKPFRHKLMQRTDKSYDPETINMTIMVDNERYNITNDLPGSGKVEISNINKHLNQTNLILPVYHNQSIEIMFNASYNLELENYLASPGNLQMSEAQDNHWSVIPIINPDFSNYSVKFNFPHNWIDVNVLRNDINITSIVDINYPEDNIIIPTNLISEGDLWEITAHTLKIDFDLDVSRTEFYTGQELKFFIADPVLEGNYTFILNDPLHDKIYTSNNSITAESNSFTFIIPSSALDGDYKAFVYWFNGTDAGVVTQVFTVILPFAIDWTLVIGIVVIVGLGSAVTASSIILTKKNKRKRLAAKEKTINKFMDILNLNYVIVIEKNSSLNVYDQAFTGKKFNSTLVSGFLEAIRTFGLDISGSEEHSQTVKLEYQNSNILMSDFKHFRLIFIMKDLPSPQFYRVIDDLSIEIEEKFGLYLKEFKGNLQSFEGIENLLRKHLGTAFLYPLKLTGIGKMKITPTEKSLINKAIAIMKQTRLEYFYVNQLIKEKTFETKEIEALYSLITKRVFNPRS